jgi:hypothetical protein
MSTQVRVTRHYALIGATSLPLRRPSPLQLLRLEQIS